ncbi:hypothetical protein GW17_00018101 [Ensete ventricosum]|uniref:Molybdate-anion transporter n=1 Tax=Ensete ventricosum TaxID=4639 RepID=A0A427AMU8_ENSVE|nr:hypothetical protein B296_00007218 [Ensete ventricosum]RWW17951.1 hypothetical protein GW17_00018101 [Ensete ventricosum]
MVMFYHLVFGGLAAAVMAMELSNTSKDRVAISSAFNAFRNNYLVVYSLMMGSSFASVGPYAYYLYSQYGYDKRDIGRLFIVGFGSSMLFGTIVGSLADKQGRKRACVTYCITYILSCMTKHFPEYELLMVGRVLGGISTSLLLSAFESWLVAEHNKVRMTNHYWNFEAVTSSVI